jgi:hypothetical protein
MHPNEEIQPLLRGEDYHYSDSNFEIVQKDRVTTFKLDNGEDTTFEISVDFDVCSEALKTWVDQAGDKKTILYLFHFN